MRKKSAIIPFIVSFFLQISFFQYSRGACCQKSNVSCCNQSLCQPVSCCQDEFSFAEQSAHNQFSEITEQIQRSPADLAKELYDAQSEVSPDRFFSLLKAALALFPDDDAFEEFLNTRNQYDWTVLMMAAIVGDIEQITAVLTLLEKRYGSDQDKIFNYLNQRSPAGFTALGFLAELGKINSLTVYVDGVEKLLKGNKKLFLQFLNTPDFNNENNPLISLVYDSQHDSLRYLILKAKSFFGENSNEFNQFINYQDVVGFTPLQYAVDVRDRAFLIRNHAVIIKRKSPEVLEAQNLGERLVESMHQDDLGSFKKHLYYLECKYKDRSDLFLYAIEARDGAGWTTLMHCVAHQSVLYLKILMHAIEKMLKESPGDIFDTLGAVDHLGRTALVVAVQRENFESGKYVMEKILEYSRNKYYFFNYITTQLSSNGLAALATGVYKSQGYGPLYDFIEFLLKKMAAVFGKESREFYRFINEQDFDHYSPLDYADSKEIYHLLLHYGAQYGAVNRKRFKEELEMAKTI